MWGTGARRGEGSEVKGGCGWGQAGEGVAAGVAAHAVWLGARWSCWQAVVCASCVCVRPCVCGLSAAAPHLQVTLEPYERDHAMVVGVYRPPPKAAK